MCLMWETIDSDPVGESICFFYSFVMSIIFDIRFLYGFCGKVEILVNSIFWSKSL